MSKLKEFFGFARNINKKNKQKSTSANETTTITKKTTTTKLAADKEKLETDAVGVYDNDEKNDNDNTNEVYYGQINNTTTTVSSELTAQTVQQLVNDNNYNNNNNNNNNNSNFNNVPTIQNTLATSVNAACAVPQNNNNNNINLNNAQQQLVMNFNNANNVHFGAVYHIKANNDNNNNKTKDTQIKHPITKKTPSIVIMMQSQIEPGVRILDTISTHLGEGWKQIMRDLGHTEGQIEQAIIDHQMHGNIREVIYQLLLQWVRSAEDNEATLGRLTMLLWERKHYEVVHRMKIAWKDQQKQKQK